MKLNCLESDRKTWRRIINRILWFLYSYFGSVSNKYLHIIIYTIWDPFAAFWTHPFHTFFVFLSWKNATDWLNQKKRNCCAVGWLDTGLPSDNLFKISWLPVSWIDIKTVWKCHCGLRICEDFSTKAGLNTALTGNVWENNPCLFWGPGIFGGLNSLCHFRGMKPAMRIPPLATLPLGCATNTKQNWKWQPAIANLQLLYCSSGTANKKANCTFINTYIHACVCVCVCVYKHDIICILRQIHTQIIIYIINWNTT